MSNQAEEKVMKFALALKPLQPCQSLVAVNSPATSTRKQFSVSDGQRVNFPGNHCSPQLFAVGRIKGDNPVPASNKQGGSGESQSIGSLKGAEPSGSATVAGDGTDLVLDKKVEGSGRGKNRMGVSMTDDCTQVARVGLLDEVLSAFGKTAVTEAGASK